jgi:hypothetical protein
VAADISASNKGRKEGMTKAGRKETKGGRKEGTTEIYIYIYI